MLNDPHVEALIYAIEHDPSVSYEWATPIEVEHQGFSLKVEDGRARFELRDHYATAGEAQAAVQPFIDQWELKERLRTGPGAVCLEGSITPKSKTVIPHQALSRCQLILRGGISQFPR